MTDRRVIAIHDRAADRLAKIAGTPAPEQPRPAPTITPRDLDNPRRSEPAITTYQVVEGEGIRRWTAQGWQWLDPRDWIDLGSGEYLAINGETETVAAIKGATAMLIVVIAALAVWAFSQG